MDVWWVWVGMLGMCERGVGWVGSVWEMLGMWMGDVGEMLDGWWMCGDVWDV